MKLEFKHILALFSIQIILAFSIMFGLSTFINTPKEVKLKNDISYLLNEYSVVHERLIQSEIILDQIKENDSIIYKSLFDVADITKKQFETYYEDILYNDYSMLVKETSEKLTALEKDLSKELYTLDYLVKEVTTHDVMVSHIPAIQPIENKNLKRTASGWGYRVHPIYKIKKFHYGLDFTARTGTPIYATGDGIILHAIKKDQKASKGYGNLIIIDHGYGYKTLYAHMNKFQVKQGDQVKRGEVIGLVGSTGLSTGPHLHYEVIKNNRKVNPIHYLFNSLTPEEYHKMVKISNSIKKSYD